MKIHDSSPATASDKVDVCFMVPVYGEMPRRILEQYRSVQMQRGVDLDRIEVLYGVNNAPDTSSEVRGINQSVLDLDIFVKPQSVRAVAIDASSPGHEIPDCNAGKARNLCLSVLTGRQAIRGRDAVVIATDGDTVFEDPYYMRKVLDIFDHQLDVVAGAGGRRLELDLDSDDDAERQYVLDRLPNFKQQVHFYLLASAIKQGRATGREKFCGWHSIYRLSAANAVGGYPDSNFGEDVLFGEALQAYAGEQGLRTLYLKDELKVRVAFRMSERTGNSFIKDFSKLELGAPVYVAHPVSSQEVLLCDKLCEELEAVVQTLPGGPEYVEFLRSGSSIAAITVPTR